MAEKIKIDVCMAPTRTERDMLIQLSRLYWENEGYELLNDDIGPDSVKIYEGAIGGQPPNKRYRPVTKYVKEPLDKPAVLIFIKR